jgi:hypothetical protein
MLEEICQRAVLAKVVLNSYKRALVFFIGTSAVTIDCANVAKAYSPSGPKADKALA